MSNTYEKIRDTLRRVGHTEFLLIGELACRDMMADIMEMGGEPEGWTPLFKLKGKQKEYPSAVGAIDDTVIVEDVRFPTLQPTGEAEPYTLKAGYMEPSKPVVPPKPTLIDKIIVSFLKLWDRIFQKKEEPIVFGKGSLESYDE